MYTYYTSASYSSYPYNYYANYYTPTYSYSDPGGMSDYTCNCSPWVMTTPCDHAIGSMVRDVWGPAQEILDTITIRVDSKRRVILPPDLSKP